MSFLRSRTPFLLRSSLSMQLQANEERNAEIDEHKDDSVSKAKGGKGEWKKELASNSEAAIKADRGEIDASRESIDKLEKETQEILGNKK